MRHLTLLIFVIFLTGCIAFSDKPIAEPDEKTFDPLMLGSWYWKQDEESGYLHIGKGKQPGMLQIFMIGVDADREVEMNEFAAHTSVIKANKYLNLLPVEPHGDAPEGYMIVKYSVNADRLSFAVMDAGVVREAIEAGTLKGRVSSKGWNSSIQISEEGKKLSEFLLKQDKALFPESAHMAKVVLPEHAPVAAP